MTKRSNEWQRQVNFFKKKILFFQIKYYDIAKISHLTIILLYSQLQLAM